MDTVGVRVFHTAVREQVLDATKLPSLPSMTEVCQINNHQSVEDAISTYEMLKGYEAYAEEILSYTKGKSPFAWGEVKEELRSEYDDIEEEELTLLGQWLGVKNDESIVGFDDCTY